MSEKAKVKETVSLYSKVWQLPTFMGILGRILLTVLMASAVISIVKILSRPSVSPLVTFSSYALVLIATSFGGTGLLYLVIRKPGSPLDTRRTFGTILLGIIAWCFLGTVGTIIDAILGWSTAEIRLWFLGLGIAFLLCAFLITGMSDYGTIRNFVGALMIPTTWITTFHAVQVFGSAMPSLPVFWLPSLIVILLIDAIVVLYIFNAVSKPFERDLGINGPSLLRAFGYDYLTDNPTPFEDKMKEIAVTQDIPLEVVLIKSGDTLKAVGVVLYIHPGPFRNIGSSGLPGTIISHIRENHGVQGFVLHGTCTHHQNLVGKEEYPRVLKKLDALIESTQTYNEVYGPIRGSSGKFTSWALGAGNNALTITTSAPHFTDDIALEIGMEAAEAVRTAFSDLNQVSIVDAHNTIGEDAVSVMPDDPEAEQYSAAVVNAVRILRENPRSKIYAGIAQLIPDNLTTEDGMGPGGIVAMVLQVEDEDFALVIADGNNVHQDFRSEVLRILLDEGFSGAEIVTTDTHVVNGVSMSKGGYPTVGSEKPELLLDMISKAVANAKDDLEPVKIGFGFDMVENLHVFGEKGFDTLTMDIAEAASIAKRTGIISGSLAFIVMFLSSILM